MGTQATPTLLLAVADARRAERIETAARKAGWSVTALKPGYSARAGREQTAVDVCILDDQHVRLFRRAGRSPPGRLLLLLLDAASPRPSGWASKADGFIFNGVEQAFAQRIGLAQAGYTSMPAEALPALLNDEPRLRRLAQLKDVQRRLAELHVRSDTVEGLAKALGQPPRATRSALRRLLRALAVPAKLDLAVLLARARRQGKA